MTRINDIFFSDIYITPEKVAYIPDDLTENGLQIFNPTDFDDFYNLVESAYEGNSSYSVSYENVLFRVERTNTINGIQYCIRKMPQYVPELASLGFRKDVIHYLTQLSKASGLILWAGATGSGKTTAISSLLKEFLDQEGGFAYTIEDPSEMPLDGEYTALNGSFGLCKQTQPINNNWGDCLKSALRSKPRYILVGEIRSPDAASECLRAATSGHLVLSTIHANNITDAINSMVKYASSSDMSEDLAYDLLSRGLLAVCHQSLRGVGQKVPILRYVFANPDTTKGCQVRSIIKSGKINLATAIETQMTRMVQGRPIFEM
ncbi:MAG: Flp pilus assembly complex ATPase component TadA [Alphaproteobacteria bacterium]|nr:Flp pilus assembly complex ATPase component TadA [Alphaproteobacteria bacterium]